MKDIVIILDCSGLKTVEPLLIGRDFLFSSFLITDEKVPLCLGSNYPDLSRVKDNITMLREKDRMIETLLLRENAWFKGVLFRQIFGARFILLEYRSAYDEAFNKASRRAIRRKLVIDCRFVANCFEFVITRKKIGVIATDDSGVLEIIKTTFNSLGIILSMSASENEEAEDSLLGLVSKHLRISVLSDMSLLFAEPSVLMEWVVSHTVTVKNQNFFC